MASQLKVDTITGVTTAGSIAVTGEGNSTTTNLQQGLAKSWCNLNFSTAAIADSFNTASITDVATGRFNANFTNAMNNALYSSSGSSRFNLSSSDVSNRAVCYQPAADVVKIISFRATDGGLTDDHGVDSQFCGDLA